MNVIAPGISHIKGYVNYPADLMADLLSEIQLVQREKRLYGKSVRTPRFEAWYGEIDYYGFKAAQMPPTLDAVRVGLECYLSEIRVIGVLANLYRTGEDSVSWHADDERELGPDPVIASLSLGATRDFKLRPKDPAGNKAALRAGASWAVRTHTVALESGDLLIMGSGVQAFYEHSVPRRKRCKDPRLNLTFRCVHV